MAIKFVYTTNAMNGSINNLICMFMQVRFLCELLPAYLNKINIIWGYEINNLNKRILELL